MTNSIREKIFKGYNLACEKVKGANALKSNVSEDDLLYSSLMSAFNELTDDKAIDYASYNLLAAKAKYSYLIKLAKEKNLSL